MLTIFLTVMLSLLIIGGIGGLAAFGWNVDSDRARRIRKDSGYRGGWINWYIWHTKKLLEVEVGKPDPWGTWTSELDGGSVFMLKIFRIYWVLLPIAFIASIIIGLKFALGTSTGLLILGSIAAVTAAILGCYALCTLIMKSVVKSEGSLIKGRKIVKVLKKVAEEAAE